MSLTQAALDADHTANQTALHMALELSKSKWVVAFSDGRTRLSKARLVTVDTKRFKRLRTEISLAKTRLGLPRDCLVTSCYEAGRDGFWVHRYLQSIGVENVIVDPASIEVNRRKRRQKTDRLDARKLLAMLVRYYQGEQDHWSVVRVPSIEDEDARQLHREIERLKIEAKQHRVRIQSLLITQGVDLVVGRDFVHQLEQIELWDGSRPPAALMARILREHERLLAVKQQLSEIEKQRRQLVRESNSARIEKVRMLQSLRGIGVNGSWVLVMEFFGWRQFRNRKQVGAAAGLAGTPFDSGSSERDQGISKAGNRRVRTMMVELAWCWLRFQPESALSIWYGKKWGPGSKRSRKVGIVALARRLLVDLWRFVEFGVVPKGAVM